MISLYILIIFRMKNFIVFVKVLDYLKNFFSSNFLVIVYIYSKRQRKNVLKIKLTKNFTN